MSDEDIHIIRNSLLEWSKTHYRNYPWRETSDPYQILIAEIMLQRTNADQVNRIYDDFINKYPSFEIIDQKSMSELHNNLKSLELFWRINNIKKISKIIVESNNGQIPNNKKDLIKLPGIGQYIAGAFLISSYNQKNTVLDSNIVRLISRLFDFPVSDNSRRNKKYEETIESLFPKKSPRIFLYAVLDFTNAVCKSRNPICVTCQLLTVCSYGRKLCM